ncbi:OTU domain-containing protein 3-like isoform X2 [Paramacrobiotus metropolitanus]|uniref:OTU domain-containing protein 3-like isoform X2 n=1 Tax=Paramacrobiotus metropolitanus TaxID=2943436 RepID=UPI002445CC76|nr:OTU domain-containing protein 3-like isoform X2 [Paramacrobiotus metropolitanus]
MQVDDLRDFLPVQQYTDLDEQLRYLGLKIRIIEGDGNCFFRAMSDQLTGNCDTHGVYRKDTAHYMLAHRELFKDFILHEDYEEYVHGLGQDAIYVDNDSVLAFARMMRLNVIVHQLNQIPLLIAGTTAPDARECHITYIPQHYNSVRWSDEEDNAEVSADVTCRAIRRLVQIHAREQRRRQSQSTSDESGSGSEREEAVRNLATDKGVTYQKMLKVMETVDWDPVAAEKALDAQRSRRKSRNSAKGRSKNVPR